MRADVASSIARELRVSTEVNEVTQRYSSVNDADFRHVN